jgi:hypothetical protein
LAKIAYKLLFSSICATCSDYLIIFDLITLVIFGYDTNYEVFLREFSQLIKYTSLKKENQCQKEHLWSKW